MGVYISRPRDRRRSPAVLILQEVFGVNDHIREVADRVASLGYVAIAPELFHRTAPARFTASYSDFEGVKAHFMAVTVETLAADFQAVNAYLKQDAQVLEHSLAAVGFCLGGRAAILANAVLPLKGAVSFYGSRMASLRDHAGQLHGPNLVFWGGQDKNIDLAQRDEARRMFREAGKEFTDVEFSRAEHGFFCDERPAFDAASARQAWVISAQFLQDCFQREPVQGEK